MEDLFLINQVLSGNNTAFRLIVRRYQRPIFKFLSSFDFSQPKLEELAQETFLKAYKNLKNYDSVKASFSTWLFIVAKNLAINETNKSYRKFEITEEVDFNFIQNNDLSQLQELEIRERFMVLKKALIGLPTNFRNAITLSYLKEFSMDEIAEIENCSVGTVKSRIFRGKQMLKAFILKELGGMP